MKSFLRHLLIAVSAAVSLHAAPIELAVSTEGNGKIQFGPAAEPISKANLVLKRDGKFSLGLVGSSANSYSGTWQPARGDDVLLRISDANGRDAKGSGEVEIRRRWRGEYEVATINLNGFTDKGRPFTGRFAVERVIVTPRPPAPVLRPPAVVLDSERRGQGRLRVDNKATYPINRVHVQLFANGRAHLHTEGARPLSYEGTWKRGRENAAILNLRGGLNGEQVEGTVLYNRDRAGRVELSGTTNRRYYSIIFDPVP